METLVGLEDDIDINYLIELPEFCNEIEGELDELFISDMSLSQGCLSVVKEPIVGCCDLPDGQGPRSKKRTIIDKLTGSDEQVICMTGSDPRKRTKRGENESSPEMGSMELILSNSMVEDFDHFSLTQDAC